LINYRSQIFAALTDCTSAVWMSQYCCRLLLLLDHSTRRLLADNQRLIEFNIELTQSLQQTVAGSGDNVSILQFSSGNV